jgi:hypothetical protein
MMVIIIPLGTIFSARRIAEWIQQNRVVTVVFQHEMNSALRPLGQNAGGYADVGEYRRVAGLDDCVHRVEAEPVQFTGFKLFFHNDTKKGDPILTPGEVLLRQLIRAAVEEGADVFDFGIGDEAYKYRFATGQEQLITWGIYPMSSRYLPRPSQ